MQKGFSNKDGKLSSVILPSLFTRIFNGVNDGTRKNAATHLYRRCYGCHPYRRSTGNNKGIASCLAGEAACGLGSSRIPLRLEKSTNYSLGRASV